MQLWISSKTLPKFLVTTRGASALAGIRAQPAVQGRRISYRGRRCGDVLLTRAQPCRQNTAHAGRRPAAGAPVWACATPDGAPDGQQGGRHCGLTLLVAARACLPGGLSAAQMTASGGAHRPVAGVGAPRFRGGCCSSDLWRGGSSPWPTLARISWMSVDSGRCWQGLEPRARILSLGGAAHRPPVWLVIAHSAARGGTARYTAARCRSACNQKAGTAGRRLPDYHRHRLARRRAAAWALSFLRASAAGSSSSV